MTFPRIFLSFAAALIVSVGCAPAGETPTVSGDGFGAVRFGMKIAEAEQALGVKLQPDNPGDDDACRYYNPSNAFPGLSFMAVGGAIPRLDVYDSKEITTDRGARIGDSEARVLDLYKGRVKVEPHFYTGPEGHYLVVTGKDGKVEIIFETDGSHVVSYRAGREPEVRYVEGCS